MKTEDLIGALAVDAEAPALPLRGALAVGTVVGAALSGLVFLAVLGPRPDIAVALTTPRFVLKLAECAVIAVAAGAVAFAMLRPAADRRAGRLCLAVAGLVVALGLVAEAALVPAAEWGGRLVGSNGLHCLVSVPLFSAPALAALLVAARRGAPTEPGRAGAMIGVLAGGIGAFFYALNCNDDSPFFVAVWYTPAILAIAALGAAIGRRRLAW
jgi:hypothetical protein